MYFIFVPITGAQSTQLMDRDVPQCWDTTHIPDGEKTSWWAKGISVKVKQWSLPLCRGWLSASTTAQIPVAFGASQPGTSSRELLLMRIPTKPPCQLVPRKKWRSSIYEDPESIFYFLHCCFFPPHILDWADEAITSVPGPWSCAQLSPRTPEHFKHWGYIYWSCTWR